MYSHVKHFWYNPNQTGYEWTKFGYETARYERTVRKKRLDTLLKSKMLSTVLNKRPPRICFFLNKRPCSNKRSFWVSSLIPMSAPNLFR